MDALSYLKSIVALDRQIQDKVERIDLIRANACNIVAPTDNERVQSSGNKDKIGNSCAKIVDLENEINGLIDQRYNAKEICLECIKQMDNNNYKEILIGKYFEDKSIYQMARELKMLERSAKRAHKNATEQFVNIFDTKFNKNA